jgi:hypothetical protein
VTKLPVELADEALAEATAAESWYRARSDRVAGRFVTELERALTLLAERPAFSRGLWM